METKILNRLKKALAVLLLVLFLVTVTATTVSPAKNEVSAMNKVIGKNSGHCVCAQWEVIKVCSSWRVVNGKRYCVLWKTRKSCTDWECPPFI